MAPDAWAWFASAFTFAVAMAATPGPNNAMVAASGATFGFARTVPHLLGVSIGFPVMLVAVALGMGEVLRAVPALHSAMKWLGAAYLLWLAYKIATAGTVDDLEQQGNSAARGRPLTFLQAALFQWINPKAWIIAAGAVSTYTTAREVVPQSLLLSGLFVLVTAPCLAFWTLSGVGAARFLRSKRALHAFNLVMAALLVASLIPLIWE